MNPSALKLRRVLQLAADLTRKPLAELRVLDLACGHGAYAIEFGRLGAAAIGIDARSDRMDKAADQAKAMGLNVSFQLGDVRDIPDLGQFDVVLVLGILYHLEAADALAVLKSVAARTDTVIVDTHISLEPKASVELDGWTYQGHHYREHRPGESEAERKRKLLASIDNETSFWFSRKSLTDLLIRAGFTSVMEAHAPVEPNKPLDRVTFAGRKGEAVVLPSHEWLAAIGQAELEARFPRIEPPVKRQGLVSRLVRPFRRQTMSAGQAR